MTESLLMSGNQATLCFRHHRGQNENAGSRFSALAGMDASYIRHGGKIHYQSSDLIRKPSSLRVWVETL